MDSTIVKVKCVSKKEKVQYSKDQPTAHEIELEVPYQQDSIFWKLSGGTNMVLNTINPDAAAMFKLGESYDVVISPTITE